jgi:signal transduction histidine kinase
LPGGHVRITAGLHAASVQVNVTDTGSGISESDMAYMWSPLFRGDQSRSKRGMGIGLSLVKAFVGLHGGKVQAKSQVGEGSTFTITLPRIPPGQT